MTKQRVSATHRSLNWGNTEARKRRRCEARCPELNRVGGCELSHLASEKAPLTHCTGSWGTLTAVWFTVCVSHLRACLPQRGESLTKDLCGASRERHIHGLVAVRLHAQLMLL